MESYEEQVKYNNDGFVNVPFGQTAQWYLANLPILKNCRLKNQSRQITSAGNLTIERV